MHQSSTVYKWAQHEEKYSPLGYSMQVSPIGTHSSCSMSSDIPTKLHNSSVQLSLLGTYWAAILNESVNMA